MPYIVEQAPAGWRKVHQESVHEQKTTSTETFEDTVEVELTQRKQAWARRRSPPGVDLFSLS